MEFSKEFLKNKFFRNQALGFNPPLDEKIGETRFKSGAILQPNGDYLFKIYAPKAENVEVELSWNDSPLVLEKKDDGFFYGIYPYKDYLTGQVGVSIYIDGALVLSPFIPIYWTLDRPCNYIEIPDYDMEFAMMHNVEHGSFTREIFYADNFKEYQRAFVYTPPGYMKNDKEYPVLYLLHGGMDNEIAWEYGANMSQIMDNLIADKKCEEFIVVMTNGMLRYDIKLQEKGKWDLGLEDMLIGSLIPYIESHYREKTEKKYRAIGGLSMGSYQTNDIGFRHPELFEYMGQFTAGITQDPNKWTYERKYKEAISNPKEFEKNYKVFFRSTTPNEDHFEFFEEDDRIYENAGVEKLPCYVRKVYPEGTSRWKSWRLGLYYYAQLIFK